MSGSSVLAASASGPERIRRAGWWRQPFRMVQTNLRLIDAGLDTDAVAEFVAAHGADAWLLNTGGIYASFPSALASQTPNPNLALRASGDVVTDALRSAHSRGLRLLARMDFSKVLPHVAAQHPEWLYVSSAGQHQVFNDLFTTCPSAGYFEAEAFEILREVLDRYDVDGFFINWFMYSEVNYAHEYLGPCHCRTCRRQWREDFGGEPPTGPADETYPAWRAWSRAKVLDLGSRLRAHIESISPDTPLILHDTADMRYIEANNAVGREFWPDHTAESVSAAFTRAPDTPAVVNCVAFLDFPYRMAGEDPERFANYLVQAMSRGASISTYMMGPPGAITYPALDVAGEVTRFHQRHDDLYAALRPAARVLLLQPGEFEVRGAVPPAVREFRGFYEALQQLHVPVDVLEASHLARVGAAALGRFDLVVAPDAAALDAGARDVLDAWVEAGGALLASLAHTAPGAPLPRSLGVAGLAGTDDGAALLSAYAQDEDGGVVPLHGTAHRVVPAVGTTTRARLVPPARFGPPEYCYGHVASEHPAVLDAVAGRGRARTVTWSIGQALHDLGLVDLRTVVQRALSELAPGAGVAGTLPESVSVSAGRSGDRRVLHLLNQSGRTRVGFGSPVPVVGAELVLPAGAVDVRALVVGRELERRPHAHGQVVVLPEIPRFEVVTWKETAP